MVLLTFYVFLWSERGRMICMFALAIKESDASDDRHIAYRVDSL